MVKFILPLILIVISSTINGFSQNAAREVFPEQVSIDHNDAVRQFSQDFVTAFQPSAASNIDQSVTRLQNEVDVSIIGDGNTVNVTQDGGIGNYVQIGMNGTNNILSTYQFGNQNTILFDMTSSSTNNTIGVNQIGDFNNFQRLRYNLSGVDATFTQDNTSGMQVTSAALDVGNTTLEITQTSARGSGTGFSVRHNN